MEPACDVIIVGAGPAGCAASMVLTRAGLSVRMVDPGDENALRVGESLPAAASRLLARLELGSVGEFLGEHGCSPCVGQESAWAGERWERRDALESPEGGGWHIDRAHFDQSLRSAARERGAEWISALAKGVSRVQESGSTLFRLELEAETRSEPLRGERTLFGRWLVDATGRSSRCGRALGARRVRVSEQMAVVRWFEVPDFDRDQSTRVVACEDGWWYSARLPNGLRVVAFHCLPERVSAVLDETDRFREGCDGTSLLPYPLALAKPVGEAVVRDAGMSRLLAPVGPGWLAVGDAAVGFDPLSSQGLLFALYSGIRGAEAILSARVGENGLGRYAGKVDRVFVANQDSRMYHYASVSRFAKAPYWRRALGLDPRRESKRQA